MPEPKLFLRQRRILDTTHAACGGTQGRGGGRAHGALAAGVGGGCSGADTEMRAREEEAASTAREVATLLTAAEEGDEHARERLSAA